MNSAEIYKEVIRGLDHGIPIYKTLKNNGVTRPTFYNSITKQQLTELSMHRIATKKYSDKANWGKNVTEYSKAFEPNYFFDDDDN